MPYLSGTSIGKFPKDGTLFYASKLINQTDEVLYGESNRVSSVPIMGFYDSKQTYAGRIVVYGDSNCLDYAHMFEQGNRKYEGTKVFIFL